MALEIQPLHRWTLLILLIPDSRLMITYLDFVIKNSIDGLTTVGRYNKRFSDINLSDESLLSASMVPMWGMISEVYSP